VKQLIRKTKITEHLKFRVQTSQQDIDEGECRLASRCMEKVAIARTLRKHLDLDDAAVRRLHVRIDAGHIHFNHEGSRWQADTPLVAKTALKDFDAERAVKPHSFTVNAQRKGKVQLMTKERQKQIRLARAKRVAEGRPDRAYSRTTLRYRIVGYT
jgi:hypothetical protein